MSSIAVASIILFAALLIALVIVDERRARRRSKGRQLVAGPRFQPGWTQIQNKRNGYSYGREMLGSDACPAPEDVRTLEHEGVAWRPWTGG